MAMDRDNITSDKANPVVSSIRAPNDIIFIAYKNIHSDVNCGLLYWLLHYLKVIQRLL